LPLRSYAWGYSLAFAAITRPQEIEADRVAVRLAGRQASISALREAPILIDAWESYLEDYVLDGLDTGLAPADVFSYFPTFLAARAQELAQARAEPPPADWSRHDSHPAVAERIALMMQAPEGEAAPDPKPATVLVQHLYELAVQLEELTFEFGDRPRVPFERYRGQTLQWQQQRQADWLYRGAARVVRGPTCLATVLYLLAAGLRT
jgi:hypothetical protein